MDAVNSTSTAGACSEGTESLPGSPAEADVIDRLLASDWIDEKDWIRTECAECGKKVRFFCPGCRRVIGVPSSVEHHFSDRLQLPVQLEVVVHDQDSKSSGILLLDVRCFSQPTTSSHCLAHKASLYLTLTLTRVRPHTGCLTVCSSNIVSHRLAVSHSPTAAAIYECSEHGAD